jgi:hypothetical protein
MTNESDAKLIPADTVSHIDSSSTPGAGTVEVQNALLKTFVRKLHVVKSTCCPLSHQSHQINKVHYWRSVKEMWRFCERDGISTGQCKMLKWQAWQPFSQLGSIPESGDNRNNLVRSEFGKGWFIESFWTRILLSTKFNLKYPRSRVKSVVSFFFKSMKCSLPT